MKIWFLFTLALPLLSEGQKIAENKTDEFTHAKVVRTSWEWVIRSSPSIGVHSRVDKINEDLFLDLKVMKSADGMESMPAGAQVMLKLDNDSIVTLTNNKLQVPCKGCGAVGGLGIESQGFELSFQLSAEQKKSLLEHPVTKMRIYTSADYLEETVKDKSGNIIQEQLKLTDIK